MGGNKKVNFSNSGKSLWGNCQCFSLFAIVLSQQSQHRERERLLPTLAAGCQAPNAFPSNNLTSHRNVRALPSSSCLNQSRQHSDGASVLHTLFRVTRMLLGFPEPAGIKKINTSEVVLASWVWHGRARVCNILPS